MRENIEQREGNVRNRDVPDTLNAVLVLVGLGAGGEVLVDVAAICVDQGDGEVLRVGAVVFLVSWSLAKGRG
jgi:hypothetical protein